jgi:two-component system, chemotaxis family, protein-glutamate methylesterase/glutaminase
MPHKDVIVVGASAGGVEVLKTLTAALPADLGAAVLVVLHLAPSSPSVLPALLQRRCALPVAFATDGEALRAGRVYVAPPDRHLVVDYEDRVRTTRAPRENHSRPAIDPLFRSAALAYGPRVIGALLSGRLDDGTAGIWAVKDRGGTVVVQDPEDALHPDMPRNALRYTTADHVVGAEAIAPLLARLVREPLPAAEPAPVPRELELEVRIAMEDRAPRRSVLSLGPISPYTCPECHGTLVRVEEGSVPRFRCHTGHAFSVDSLLASVTESVEEALWNALRVVEESAMLLREAADGGRGDDRFEDKARDAEARADMIRHALRRHQALSFASVRAARGEGAGTGGTGGTGGNGADSDGGEGAGRGA